MMNGCSIGMTDEEKAAREEAVRLEQEKQEEAATGLKRLTSANLDEIEKEFKNFVEGLQEEDTAKVAKVLDVPNIFGDNSLYGWALSNAFDKLIDNQLSDIRIKTERDKTTAIITVFIGENITEPYTTFFAEYHNKGWNIRPQTGLVNGYTFEAPSKKISCNGTSLSEYAVSVEDGGRKWYFELPLAPEIENSAEYTIETDLGEYSAQMYNVKNGRYLLAHLTEEQRRDFEDIALTSIRSAYELLKNNCSADELSTVLINENALMACFPANEATNKEYHKNLESIIGVELYEDDVQTGFPTEYTYRLSGDAGFTMNIKLKVITTTGESRQKVTVIMQNLNDSWKIVSMTGKRNNNPFTDFRVYNPEW